MTPEIRLVCAIATGWLAPLLTAAAVQRYLRRGAIEPDLRLRAVLLGMLTLGGAALVISQLLARVTMLPWPDSLPETARILVEATFGAGIPEELAKWPLILGLVRLTGARSRAAAVLCGLGVGLGFAGYETAFGAVHADALTVLISRFTANISHGCWGVLTGWFIGRAFESPYPKARLLLAGFLIPTLLHGASDFLIGISVPGSLVETTVTTAADAAPSPRELAGMLGALGIWIGQLVWCGRVVRSSRPALVRGGAAV